MRRRYEIVSRETSVRPAGLGVAQLPGAGSQVSPRPAPRLRGSAVSDDESGTARSVGRRERVIHNHRGTAPQPCSTQRLHLPRGRAGAGEIGLLPGDCETLTRRVMSPILRVIFTGCRVDADLPGLRDRPPGANYPMRFRGVAGRGPAGGEGLTNAGRRPAGAYPLQCLQRALHRYRRLVRPWRTSRR